MPPTRGAAHLNPAEIRSEPESTDSTVNTASICCTDLALARW